jgi:hypothetical protein
VRHYAESNATSGTRKKEEFPSKEHIEMSDWVTEHGGNLHKLEWGRGGAAASTGAAEDLEEDDEDEDEDDEEDSGSKAEVEEERAANKAAALNQMVAAEKIAPGEVVLDIPLKMSLNRLTARNVKVGNAPSPPLFPPHPLSLPSPPSSPLSSPHSSSTPYPPPPPPPLSLSM